MTRQTLLVVPSMSNNVLTVFDLDTHEPVRYLGLPKRGPSTVFASPGGEKLYCLASGASDVVVVDVATWDVDHVIPVQGTVIDRGKMPAQGRNFWVSVITQGHIHQVDTASGAVIRSFPKAGPCFDVSGDEQTLFTLEADKRKRPGVFRTRSVETGEVLGETPTPAMNGFPLGLWNSGPKVYWSELSKAGALHVADVSDPTAPKYLHRIPVGCAPLGADFMSDGTLWSPNAGDGTVTVLDTATDQVVATIDVNRYVGAAAEVDGRVYLNQVTKPGRVGFWKAMWITIPAPYLGVYVTPKTGSRTTRRVLDIPAEVVAYDAATYERLPLPAMKLPSIGFTSAVIVREVP
jgi:YVTN family beta-propeller protein